MLRIVALIALITGLGLASRFLLAGPAAFLVMAGLGYVGAAAVFMALGLMFRD